MPSTTDRSTGGGSRCQRASPRPQDNGLSATQSPTTTQQQLKVALASMRAWRSQVPLLCPPFVAGAAGAAGQAQPPRPAQPKSAASSAFSALTSRDLGAPSPRHRSKKGEQENTEKQGNGETAKQVLTSESANSRLRKTRLGLGSVAVQITVPCLNTHTETHTRQFEVAVPGTDSMGRGERESLFCPGSSGGVVGPSRDT